MKKTFLSLVILAVLLLGMISVYAASMTTETNGLKEASINYELTGDEIAELKQDVPESYDVVEKKIAEIMPIPNRFLLWTNDGKHIMWGTYGGGYFRGVDNLGKKVWGIYHNGIFAGFYDGDAFFYGRYSNGSWMAHGLFGLRTARGRYVLFPSIQPLPIEPVPVDIVASNGK